MTARKTKLATLLATIMILVTLGQVATFPTSHLGISQPRPLTQATPQNLQLNVTLHGRGATFPAPLINLWGTQYHSLNPGVTITYDALGSGAGQLALMQKTTTFAASDAPLSQPQRDAAPNVLHIPEAIGSVVLAYNITNTSGTQITTGLNLTGAIIASIYLGAIHLWDDPAIQSLNPTIALPHQNITAIHRSDSSGTTFVFSSYLTQESTTWATTPGLGAATSITWPGSPTGSPLPFTEGGSGNGGVATLIKHTSFSIGYIELQYALCSNPPTCTAQPIPYAFVQNADATKFVQPTFQSTLNAVTNYTLTHTFPNGIDSWASVSMLNQPGTNTYSIASFTYILVYRELNVYPQQDVNETGTYLALKAFLTWVVNQGQAYSQGLAYVPLPASVVAIDMASINSITFTIHSTPLHRTIALQANSVTGWNGSATGPTISAFSGDGITLNLISTDSVSTSHRWFLDFNNNGVIDPNENNTTVSPIFSSTTATPFPFVPHIFNITSIPAAGNWTYRDSFFPTFTGIFRILPAQIAIPFQPPHQNPTANPNPGFPILDTSRIITVGSVLVDLRTMTASGFFNTTSVDTSSRTVTHVAGYTLSGLALTPSSGGFGLKFIMKIPTSPYTLSSNVIIQLSGISGTVTYQLSRSLDIANTGRVDISSLATVALYYKEVEVPPPPDPNFHYASDINADGSIGIDDLAAVAFFYHDTALSPTTLV